MKTFTKIFTAVIATALFATGCVNEDPAYRNTTPEPEPGTTGFLAVEALSMRVVIDTDTQGSDTSEDAGTRAVPETDDFIVEIFNTGGTSVYKSTYGELAAATEDIELAVGTYTLEVRSEETIPDVAWEHPVYGGKREFSILKAKTTNVGEIVCTLKNIKVTLLCSADLASQLTSDTSAKVSLGSTEATFVKGETRAVYFKRWTRITPSSFCSRVSSKAWADRPRSPFSSARPSRM